VPVDGGLPGHLPQLRSHLEGSGRSLGDIRAVLLTHAHPDHTGAAAAVRQAGADVWVHQRDAAVERWLREDVVPVYDAMQADPARGVPAEKVMAAIRRRHAERRKGKRGT